MQPEQTMKSPAWTSPPAVINLSRAIFRHAVLLAIAAGTVTSFGQSVISGPSVVSNLPPSFPQPPASDSSPHTLSENSPFQWGFVTAHPYIEYRFLYGDGIQSTPGKQSKTSIHTITPGVLLNLGTHWTLDYSPTQTYYSDSNFKDTLDHSVRILGGTSYNDWSFRLSQTFTATSDPQIETGRQTTEDSYDTTASVGYHFSNQLQLETTFGYQARFTTLFSDSRETTVGEKLHYQFLPRVDAAIGLDYGYDDVETGIDMSFTRPSIQLDWRATDKTNFILSAAVEDRKFRTAGASNLKSPILGAAFVFRPFTTTTINLAANRGVSVSYFTNQITRNTDWSLGIQQRLLQHYYLSAGYSGQKSSYLSTDPTVIAGRADRSNIFNIKLSTVFFQRTTVAVLYQNTHNSSNSSGFAFTSSQVGAEIGYRF
jgi:hypothetical protein